LIMIAIVAPIVVLKCKASAKKATE
jgi:hypothetical protein